MRTTEEIREDMRKLEARLDAQAISEELFKMRYEELRKELSEVQQPGQEKKSGQEKKVDQEKKAAQPFLPPEMASALARLLLAAVIGFVLSTVFYSSNILAQRSWLLVFLSGLAICLCRINKLHGVEFAFYWLGSSIVAMLLCSSLPEADRSVWALIVFSSGLTICLCRRDKLHGVELAFYWLGCCGAVVVLTSIALQTSTHRWLPGWVFVLLSGLALCWYRRDRLHGVELACYWLGCSLAVGATLTLFLDVQFPGSRLPHFGLHAGTMFALVSGLALCWYRRDRLHGVEIACYWLGCSLAFWDTVLVLFDWANIHLPGQAKDASAVCVGATFALMSGLVLCWYRRSKLYGAETVFYWLVCSLFLGTLLGILAGIAGVGTGVVVALLSGLALRLRRRQ